VYDSRLSGFFLALVYLSLTLAFIVDYSYAAMVVSGEDKRVDRRSPVNEIKAALGVCLPGACKAAGVPSSPQTACMTAYLRFLTAKIVGWYVYSMFFSSVSIISDHVARRVHELDNQKVYNRVRKAREVYKRREAHLELKRQSDA